MLVDHLVVITTERHRAELLRTAARARREAGGAHVASVPLTPGARRHAVVSELWDGHRQSEVETADILGDWSWGYAPKPRTWPAWRAVLDWSAWAGLLLVICYVAAGG